MFRELLVFLVVFAPLTVESSIFVSRHKRSDDTSALTPVVSALTQQITQLEAKMTALEASMTQQQQLIQQQHDKAAVQVGFHARLSSNHAYHQDNTVKYDVVQSNQGGGYDKNSGIFTVPVSGLYIFVVSSSGTDIIHSGSVYLSIDNHDTFHVDAAAKVMATGHGVYKLTKGQRVWVAGNARNDQLLGQDSSFSGFLINQDW